MNPNLIPCPDCDNPLSPSANFCPRCGYNHEAAAHLKMQQTHEMVKQRQREAHDQHIAQMKSYSEGQAEVRGGNAIIAGIFLLFFGPPLGVILWVLYRAFFT